MRRAAAIAALLLAGACSRGAAPSPSTGNTATGLEAAAIEAGVIADPDDADMTGFYARDTDKVCIVPSASAYRIGVSVDYGDAQRCAGTGSATKTGETVHVALDGAAGCRFDARFEGDRLVFPGSVPDGCRALCADRASLAGLAVDRLSGSAAEAATLRDPRGRLLCSDE